VVAELTVPTPQPTSVCLAAGHVIVTSAWSGLDPRPAGAGLLYAASLADVGIRASAAPAAAYRAS
jgi:sugar lactone lactonase YvrE